jgi:cytidylate kinase
MNIALSRETGTHASEIAALVGEQLGWRVYDHELIQHIADELRVDAGLVAQHDERRIPWIQETMTILASVPAVRESQYVRQLVEKILELGAQAQGVFVGRGATWILPLEKTLRVGLMAPHEHRVHVIMREQEISHHDATQLVDELDRQRARFAKAHFCSEGIDLHAYDIVLNTSRLSVAHCAELIVTAVRDRAELVDRLGS